MLSFQFLMSTPASSPSPGASVSHAKSHAPNQLPRAIGSLGAIAIVVGTIIGSGIFLVPHYVALEVGSVPSVILIWIVGGALALAGSLSLAELGAATPEAGGVYVYLRDAYGKLAAFLYGWAALLVIESGGIATLAVAFSIYSSTFFPLTPLERKLVASAVIAVLTLVNIAGVRQASVVQTFFTLAKLTGVAIIVGFALFPPPPGADCASAGIFAAACHTELYWSSVDWGVVGVPRMAPPVVCGRRSEESLEGAPAQFSFRRPYRHHRLS